MPYAFIAAFVFAFGVASSAFAHDPAGHAKHHDELYKSLKQPGTGMSCCNNMDCRPVPHRITTTGVEFFVHGRWLLPPASKLIELPALDATSHWCGVNEHTQNPITFCAIVPRGGV
jgi:hypothetical protein